MRNAVISATATNMYAAELVKAISVLPIWAIGNSSRIWNWWIGSTTDMVVSRSDLFHARSLPLASRSERLAAKPIKKYDKPSRRKCDPPQQVRRSEFFLAVD